MGATRSAISGSYATRLRTGSIPHEPGISSHFSRATRSWSATPCSIAVQGEYRLVGLRRAVYELCDRGRTEADLLKALAADDELSPADLRAALSGVLAELVDARLLLLDEGRYLTLAVSVDFQLDLLARRYAEDQPLTERMKRARARFFDARMPALTAAFAKRVLAASQFQYVS